MRAQGNQQPGRTYRNRVAPSAVQNVTHQSAADLLARRRPSKATSAASSLDSIASCGPAVHLDPGAAWVDFLAYEVHRRQF